MKRWLLKIASCELMPECVREDAMLVLALLVWTTT